MQYVASKLSEGDSAARLRERIFTRWMPKELRQVAVDFGRKIGLAPIFSEHRAEGLTRYLFWSPPEGTLAEVRSGRDQGEFELLDAGKVEKGWLLLTLHMSPEERYSAVWVTPEGKEAATAVLERFGITPAAREA